MKKTIYSFIILVTFACSGCGSGEEKKHESMPAADTSKGVSAMAGDSSGTALAYICPCGGCPEVREAAPGKCPKCEMDLVEEKK